MNGKDLLKGMSNVNERYVQEAEIQFLQKKARIRWMSGLALAACIALLISGSIINGVFHARLSETEILALREKYPIYEYWKSEALIGSFRRVFVEEKVRGGSIQDFVYVEATGEAETYYKHRTINNKITKNKEETNTNWWDEYFSYTVMVIKDTEGLFEEGEEIKLFSHIGDDIVLPDLEEGMQVVVPVCKWHNLDADFYGWTSVGLYYVTDDGYVISAYDEESSAENIHFSGIKVNKLMRKLEQLMDENKSQ